MHRAHTRYCKLCMEEEVVMSPRSLSLPPTILLPSKVWNRIVEERRKKLLQMSKCAASLSSLSQTRVSQGDTLNHSSNALSLTGSSLPLSEVCLGVELSCVTPPFGSFYVSMPQLINTHTQINVSGSLLSTISLRLPITVSLHPPCPTPHESIGAVEENR